MLWEIPAKIKNLRSSIGCLMSHLILIFRSKYAGLAPRSTKFDIRSPPQECAEMPLPPIVDATFSGLIDGQTTGRIFGGIGYYDLAGN